MCAVLHIHFRRIFTVLKLYFRYFILDNGLLSYGKNAAEVKRGRTIGCIDVGSSVISAKTELFRIDIDDESFIHHLKVFPGRFIRKLSQPLISITLARKFKRFKATFYNMMFLQVFLLLARKFKLLTLSRKSKVLTISNLSVI